MTTTRKPTYTVHEHTAPIIGYQWRQCLCDKIDPSDLPCVPCQFRYERDVPPHGELKL